MEFTHGNNVEFRQLYCEFKFSIGNLIHWNYCKVFVKPLKEFLFRST